MAEIHEAEEVVTLEPAEGETPEASEVQPEGTEADNEPQTNLWGEDEKELEKRRLEEDRKKKEEERKKREAEKKAAEQAAKKKKTRAGVRIGTRIWTLFDDMFNDMDDNNV